MVTSGIDEWWYFNEKRRGKWQWKLFMAFVWMQALDWTRTETLDSWIILG